MSIPRPVGRLSGLRFWPGLAAVRLLAPVFTLAACALQPPCPPETRAAVLDGLYFGTAKPDGVVAREDWNGFLEGSVAPRFPLGSTSWEASGRWRDAAGRVTREASRVLHIVHPDSPESEQALRQIMAEYKARFRQEAVLRVRSPVCAGF